MSGTSLGNGNCKGWEAGPEAAGRPVSATGDGFDSDTRTGTQDAGRPHQKWSGPARPELKARRAGASPDPQQADRKRAGQASEPDPERGDGEGTGVAAASSDRRPPPRWLGSRVHSECHISAGRDPHGSPGPRPAHSPKASSLFLPATVAQRSLASP